MRIISGTIKGKKLFTPKTDNIRPTTDRTREAIFSILYSKLSNGFNSLRVLDIFSGSGAFGLEALSRGAENVCFLDIDLTLTQKNAKLCGFTNISYQKTDARRLKPATNAYDIIFMDAPYNQGLTLPVLENLYQKNYLKETTIIIVELEKEEHIDLPQTYTQIDERVYGISKILFLTKGS